MKNLKFLAVMLVISLSLAACNTNAALDNSADNSAKKEDGIVLAIDQDSKRILVNSDHYGDIWLSIKKFKKFDNLEIYDRVQFDIYGPVAESDPAKGSAKNVHIIEKRKMKGEG
jgi:hypothetical protein